MNILYIGQIVPNELIKNCTGYSVAGDVMQKNIVCGLSRKQEVNISVVSVLPNASYPSDKKYVPESRVLYEGMCINNCAYCNLPIIKQFSQKNAIYKFTMRQLKNNKYDCILCFNMYPQFGKAALKLQKELRVPLVGIIADLPVESMENYIGVKKLLFRALRKVTFNNLKKLKHGILLNENASRFMSNTRDYVVIPGGVNEKEGEHEYQEIKEKRIIYAGALTKYSGVRNLVEAIRQIDEFECTLEIYGDGELKEYVSEVSKRDSRIQYMGCRDIDEMRQIMRRAWLLVNPRDVEDPVSQVTFPSKIFEYIMCLRPVVATEFSGMPREISDLICGCGDGTPREIKQAIYHIWNTDEKIIREKCLYAKNYIVNSMSLLHSFCCILGFLA